MFVETEAKLRVASHEPVRDRLRALGATFIARVLESNWIMDRPDGTLRRAGRGLRVRAITDVASGERSATLTLKGPRRGGAFKAREEHEIQISSAETATAILKLLGFVEILRYQKRRESWSLGACRIELDEPPRLGLFIEIEGPDEAAIRSVQSELDLADLPHVSESYVGMLWEYCLQHGITDRVLDWPETGAPSR